MMYHTYNESHILGCNNAARGGSFSKVKRLVGKWIGTRKRLFRRKNATCPPPSGMFERLHQGQHVRKTATCSPGIFHPYNHLCTHTTTYAPIQPLMHPYNHLCTHTTTDAPIQPLMHPYNHWCTHTTPDAYSPLFMGYWNMQTYLVSNPFWAGDGRLCGKFPPYCVFETPAFIDVLLSSSLKVASFKSGNFDPRKVTRVLRNPRVLWLYPNIYTVAS